MIIEKIREVPGFQDFLKIIPFDKLQLSADEGPVIMINHSKYRSDAIILLRGHEPMVVSLSQPVSNDSESESGQDTFADSFYEEALDQSNNLTETRMALGDNPKLYDDTLMSVLEWLWVNIVSRVVKKFNELGVKKQSRIWWCPTFVLCSLPLHAAGPYRDEHNSRVYILDEYVSSCTPTLTALIQARTMSSNGSTPIGQIPKLLAIGYPGKIFRLPNVPKEIGVVRNHADKCLEEEEATKVAVLENLRDSSWVHFSCHGHLKPGSPFDSSFELFDDERLMLLNIVENQLPNAEFAFLSACHSAAQTHDSVPDEVLHLAAAMQFCGFRSVVGTMWAMNDGDGPEIVKNFYKRMFSKNKDTPEHGFRRSARALQKAVWQLRASGVPMERWVNLIHIGA